MFRLKRCVLLRSKAVIPDILLVFLLERLRPSLMEGWTLAGLPFNRRGFQRDSKIGV